MPDKDHLLVTFFKKGSFFSKMNGVLRLRGDDLAIEVTSGQNSKVQPGYRIPLAQIKDVELEKKLFSSKLVFKSRSRNYFENLPGSDGITFELGIKKAQSSKAESFFKALKLRHSEIVLRGLTDEPTA